MSGTVFKQDLQRATGHAWEEWIVLLEQTVENKWSHEQIRDHLCRHYKTSDDWSEWIALMYGQLMGRVPVGVTQDAGVQIGVRKTMAVSKEKVWHFLTSKEGLSLWIGDMPPLEMRVGHTFQSKEGVSGKLTVVKPYQKLRMTWQRPEWEKPSRLQIHLLSNSSGKTTVAIHQEMLEDIYMRDIMKRFWMQSIEQMKEQTEGIQ